MNQAARKALKLLRRVKSVTFATIEDGLPAARVADVMLVDDDGLYFTTARGKAFYRQLGASSTVAICGMDENYVTVRLVGDVRRVAGEAIVDKIFEHNPVMNDLYPGEKRYILEGFHMHSAKGEVFDLSITPPRRERFAFGGATVNPPGYRITDACIACGTCQTACPVDAISAGAMYIIDAARCLECGTCAEVCPVDAVEPALGL